MANSSGGLAVLPQFQGSYAELQQQQALAQALMQKSLQGQAAPAPGTSGQYTVAAKTSPLDGLSQLGQAYLGAKMGQQTSQGLNGLGQQQWAALSQMMGGAQPPQGGAPMQSPQPQPGAADASGVGSNAIAGTDGGNGNNGAVDPSQAQSNMPTFQMPNAGPPAAPAQPAAPAAPAQSSAAAPNMNPLGLPPAMAAMMYLNAPDKFFEAQAGAYKPTDMSLMLKQAGIDPSSGLGRSILQQSINKANYIAPTSIRPGGGVLDPNTGQITTTPSPAPEGYQNVQLANGSWATVPVQGGTQAVAATSQAKASGPASYNLQKVWNPATNQFELQPATNVAAAAGGASANIPLPLRNNNPGAVSPGGVVASYPTMQAGLQKMDANLAGYAGQPGTNTLGGVISKWVGSPPNAPAYISDVSSRLGIPANTPVDLTNPAQRQAISTAIMLHENGPQAIFSSQIGAQGQQNAPESPALAMPTQGAMAAEPPLGAPANANAAQAAPAQTMKDSYSRLQSGNSSANAALEALQKMQTIAAAKSPLLTAGPLGTNVAPLVSPQAAEYEKQRANVIALLANQNGTNGTDAGRALTGESVPDYGKPAAAIKDGLATLTNQVQAQQLKTQLLTPAYNAGDSKTYTSLENGFDQNVSPSMMPQLTQFVAMPPGPSRAAAFTQAIKDPRMKAALNVLTTGGVIQ